MLSQTIEYALRAMNNIAAQRSDSSQSSEAIALMTKVPRRYLSKILRDLARAELVRSQRGPNGGFVLARPASQITMLDVISAVAPLTHITECPLGNPGHLSLCPLHRRLEHAIELIENEFRKTTLAELVESAAQAGEHCRSLSGRHASTPVQLNTPPAG